MPCDLAPPLTRCPRAAAPASHPRPCLATSCRRPIAVKHQHRARHRRDRRQRHQRDSSPPQAQAAAPALPAQTPASSPSSAAPRARRAVPSIDTRSGEQLVKSLGGGGPAASPGNPPRDPWSSSTVVVVLVAADSASRARPRRLQFINDKEEAGCATTS